MEKISMVVWSQLSVLHIIFHWTKKNKEKSKIHYSFKYYSTLSAYKNFITRRSGICMHNDSISRIQCIIEIYGITASKYKYNIKLNITA